MRSGRRMFSLLILTSIAAVIISVASGEKLLFLSALTILVWYFYSVHKDLFAVVERFENSWPIDGGRKGTREIFSHKGRTEPPRTGLGREFLGQIEAVLYRLHVLTNDLEAEAFLRGLGEEDTIDDLPLARYVDETYGLDESFLYEKILGYVSRKFTCQACALVIVDEEKGRSPEVVSHGITSKRFENHLLRFLSPYFDFGQEDLFGLRDAEGEDSILGAFSVFGLRYTICLPLRWKEGPIRKDGVLWLGYTENHPPRAKELELLREVTRKVERDLEACRQLYELSGRVEQAETVNKEKSEFIAHMSHDIRSPLNNIKSILSLFKFEGLTEETAEMIDIALNNCESMGEIVEDILDYSKFSAGKLTTRREVIDLARCVANVTEGFAVTARLKGLTLFRNHSGTPAMINADKKQVKRIISNIISNAIKYTSKGSIEVAIVKSSGENWSLRVKDTGIGMTSEQVKHLFTPFTRYHGSEIEGIGLGLTLTKILTDLNGGQVRVASIPGEGTEFVIELPVAESQEVLRRNENLMGTRVRKDGRERVNTVLVVDDDADCVDTLARSLEGEGFRVMKSLTVRDAISILNFESPDLVITDATMPSGGGKEILRHLKENGRKTGAIVISGRDSDDDNKDFVALGAVKVLSKPADIDGLIDFINGWSSTGVRKADLNLTEKKVMHK